jgi:DNA-binding NarL/FixJ family response regulator
MIRIMLADDHDVVRRGLRELLEEHEGWEVCGEAANGREAVEMVKKLRPNVAVVDLAMPELNGLEATRHIRKEAPETEILVFTMHESEHLVRDVLEAGARGFVLKSDAARYLTTAVEALVQHKPFFTSKVSELVLDEFLRAGKQHKKEVPASSSVLTPREREIVQLLAESKSNKEISTMLNISVKTVETHRAAIMRKLGINSIVELVHYAVRNELVEA